MAKESGIEITDSLRHDRGVEPNVVHRLTGCAVSKWVADEQNREIKINTINVQDKPDQLLDLLLGGNLPLPWQHVAEAR